MSKQEGPRLHLQLRLRELGRQRKQKKETNETKRNETVGGWVKAQRRDRRYKIKKQMHSNQTKPNENKQNKTKQNKHTKQTRNKTYKQNIEKKRKYEKKKGPAQGRRKAGQGSRSSLEAAYGRRKRFVCLSVRLHPVRAPYPVPDAPSRCVYFYLCRRRHEESPFVPPNFLLSNTPRAGSDTHVTDRGRNLRWDKYSTKII